MTLEALKNEIQLLPTGDREALTQWLNALELDSWDTEILRDFSDGGRGQVLLDEARADRASGGTMDLSEFLIRAKQGDFK